VDRPPVELVRKKELRVSMSNCISLFTSHCHNPTRVCWNVKDLPQSWYMTSVHNIHSSEPSAVLRLALRPINMFIESHVKRPRGIFRNGSVKAVSSHLLLEL